MVGLVELAKIGDTAAEGPLKYSELYYAWRKKVRKGL
jgi:hypothetical protein